MKIKKKMVMIILVCVGALALAICTGFLIWQEHKPQIWFPSMTHTAFQAVEEQGYVSVCNQSASSEGVKVTVRAVFSDQVTTFVRIKAEGKALKNFYNADELLSNKIQTVTLKDEQGHIWGANIQDVEELDSGIQFMNAFSLPKNELILIFNGGPAQDGNLTLDITFKHTPQHFVIDNLFIKVPEKKEILPENTFLNLGFGKAQVKKIVCTAIETRFTLIWDEDTRAPEDYGILNKGLYKNGDYEYRYYLPQPNHQNIDSAYEENVFVLPKPIDLDKGLLVQRYRDETYIGDVLSISPAI